MAVLVTCKFEEDLIKKKKKKKKKNRKNREKAEISFSPLEVNGSFLLPWKPGF